MQYKHKCKKGMIQATEDISKEPKFDSTPLHKFAIVY